jgi:hypothetical protein
MTAVNGKRPLEAECLRCGTVFTPRKYGHIYCSPQCRHRGERGPHDPPAVDPEQVDRLFDLARDPGERVRDDDWFHPLDAAPEWKALYAHDTVEGRRRWYLTLVKEGRL